MTETPKLLSTVYTSVAAEPFGDAQLGALLEHSRAANARVDVTGLLLHREGRFIQFLEGPEPAVRDLLATIAADPRHTRVRVLLEQHVAARQFPEWTMGYASPGESEEIAPGRRRSFEDLESGDDDELMVQAARDLTMWFRTRTRPAQ